MNVYNNINKIGGGWCLINYIFFPSKFTPQKSKINVELSAEEYMIIMNALCLMENEFGLEGAEAKLYNRFYDLQELFNQKEC